MILIRYQVISMSGKGPIPPPTHPKPKPAPNSAQGVSDLLTCPLTPREPGHMSSSPSCARAFHTLPSEAGAQLSRNNDLQALILAMMNLGLSGGYPPPPPPHSPPPPPPEKKNTVTKAEFSLAIDGVAVLFGTWPCPGRIYPAKKHLNGGKSPHPAVPPRPHPDPIPPARPIRSHDPYKLALRPLTHAKPSKAPPSPFVRGGYCRTFINGFCTKSEWVVG
ncbi:hypothetical protein CTheo_431 [Ceratobasidium theobromae]|uniref:Uncharacterized protein n=1 Tax=Ceratobasidium theobromae TaxID=1582974 RepID=A0A5N5QX19_9AGAM|nr:hypothetical protein CTheo_431 [Ceratobasidium theobromae]